MRLTKPQYNGRQDLGMQTNLPRHSGGKRYNFLGTKEMENLKDVLINAINIGETINIIYHGGSQPGSLRQILPISINDDDVRARCLSTNRVKIFKLSKMELSESSKTQEAYVPGKIEAEPETLKDAFNSYKSIFNKFDWILTIDDEEAGIYRKFNNGKIRKTPDVYIQYHEFTYDYTDFDDNDNEIEYTKPSTKPWYVRSNITDQSSSFKKLSSAIEKFVNFSKSAAEELGLSNNAQ